MSATISLAIWPQKSTNIKGKPRAKQLGRNCICTFLPTEPCRFYRLDLDLYHDMLKNSSIAPEDRIFMPENLQSEISLGSLLSFEEKSWDLETKLGLSVLLAYTVLYFYGGSQFQEAWRRENILFFCDGRRVPLLPFLGIAVSPSPDDTTTALNHGLFHGQPAILLLGVLLLEIYLGQTLESFFKLKTTITGNDLYLYAWKALDSSDLHCVSPRYRKAIRACISPATFKEMGDDNQKIRSEVFRSIIKPIEEDIARDFRKLDFRDLDKVAAERCNLAFGVSSERLSLSSTLTASAPSNDDSVVKLTQLVHVDELFRPPPTAHRPVGEFALGRELGRVHRPIPAPVVQESPAEGKLPALPLANDNESVAESHTLLSDANVVVEGKR
jgi:hypothetical protein